MSDKFKRQAAEVSKYIVDLETKAAFDNAFAKAMASFYKNLTLTPAEQATLETLLGKTVNKN